MFHISVIWDCCYFWIGLLLSSLYNLLFGFSFILFFLNYFSNYFLLQSQSLVNSSFCIRSLCLSFCNPFWSQPVELCCSYYTNHLTVITLVSLSPLFACPDVALFPSVVCLRFHYKIINGTHIARVNLHCTET